MDENIKKALQDWERKHNLYHVNRTYGEQYQRIVNVNEIMDLCNRIAQEAQRQLNELYKLLPDCYYMDPPDGGSVTPFEQFQRMAKDAALMRSAPMESIGAILGDAMDQAVQNGADSRSMPDHYVGIAAWLCDVVHGPEYQEWLSSQNVENLRIEKHLDGFLLTAGKPMYGDSNG